MTFVPNWFVGLKATCETPIPFPQLVEGMRLIHPADYHVTIAFFGQLTSDPGEVLKPLLEQMRSNRLSAVATHALLLPREHFASVVALGFEEGSDALSRMIDRWRDRLRDALELEPERRSVLPHLTVARMRPRRDRRTIEERLRWASALTEALPLRFSFDRIGLYTWQPVRSPDLPAYRVTRWIELE